MTHYYFHDGQQEQGPFSIEQLKSKSLKTDTPIWHEDLQNWTIAGNVEELKNLFNSSPTPPPLFSKKHEFNTSIPKSENASYSTVNNFQDNSPAKKKSILVPLLIVGIIFIGGLFIWSLNRGNQTSSEVSTNNETVVSNPDVNVVPVNKEEEERKRKNQEITIKNMNFRNNWENYIKVEYSEPTVDYTLGGISEFNVNINNQTSYMLDQVDVFVQYIRKNGDVCQTKTVTIFNIPAGSFAYSEAPSSLNGVKVYCIIEKIISKKMHFCYPGNNDNPKDINFCD
jgi:hypothetical protein